MITQKRIVKEVGRYRSSERVKLMNARQDEYKQLVQSYSISAVATASGLTKGTIVQYLGTANPSIGFDSLQQAKAVLGKLSETE